MIELVPYHASAAIQELATRTGKMHLYYQAGAWWAFRPWAASLTNREKAIEWITRTNTNDRRRKHGN